MTRLPYDSFLPSGAMEAELHLSPAGLVGSPRHSHDPFSVISPLALPGGVHYFETVMRPSVTSNPANTADRSFSPRNGVPRHDPPQAQPASFLSPHLTPIPSHALHQLQFQRHPQQRASSLSPTRGSSGRRRDLAMDRKIDAEISPPTRVVPSGLSVPVDTISGTGSGLITVRRPAVRTIPAPDSQSANLQTSTDQGYSRLE